jgi:hypothetical protein
LSARLLTEEIGRTGRECSLEVPFLRPQEGRSGRHTHCSRTSECGPKVGGEGRTVRCRVCPSAYKSVAPAEDIDGSIELWEASGADSLISFVDVGEKHPARMKFVGPDGRVSKPPFAEEFLAPYKKTTQTRTMQIFGSLL